MEKYKPTIGLEIHVELKTKTKMFCDCLNETWKIGVQEIEPNKNVCPICMAHPGTLPVINKSAVEMVVKAGLALNCKIANKSKFDRKNYFYPDLPKGYQISQYDKPLCENGYIKLSSTRSASSGSAKKIGITRVHLEEDTGKLTHVKDGSLVDYNRAGVPLMEMVSEPDIESGIEAKEFCQEIQAIFRELEIADADMEKGQMRCEVNISLRSKKQEARSKEKLGTKVEIKNLNSFRAVERSIDYEIQRQSKLLNSNKKVVQETMGWDEKKQETISQRIKEGSADYRYFPEPDLPPLRFGTQKHKNTKTQKHKNFINIERLKASLPELPMKKRQRFIHEYGFKSADAKILTSHPELADYAEQVISELRVWLVDSGEFEGTEQEIWEQNKNKVIKLVSGWLINKLAGLLTARKLSYTDNKITGENFAEFITMILTGKVSTKNANILLEKMLETGGDPSNILQDEDLSAGDLDLEKIIDKIINQNPDNVEKFKAGKTVLLKFFIGQVMKESKGKADPKTTEDLLIQKLS